MKKPGPERLGAREQARVVHDETAWPIVIAVFQSAYTTADVELHIRTVEKLIRRQQRFGMVYALEYARLVTAAERRLLADFIRQHSTSIRHWVAGCAIASTNSMHRGALTALSWLVPLPFPTRVCNTVAEGKAWLSGELDRPAPSAPTAKRP